MTQRVLVTGGRGFLAGALISALKRASPRPRLFLTRRDEGPGAVACDLLDPGAVRDLLARVRPDVIFHLAGTTKVDSEARSWEGNVETTRNVLEATRGLSDPSSVRIVIAASSAEYGAPAGRPGPVSEDAPCRPVSMYGRVKFCQTLLARSYLHAGLQVIVARIFNVVGPGMPAHLSLGSFASQITRIIRGQHAPEIRVGNLTPKRDYVDVRDAADALIRIARKGAAGEIYNVCSGRSHPMGDLLERLIRLSSAKIEIVQDASRRKAADVPDIFGSFRKLSSTTGWRPTTPLERSLSDTLTWHLRK
ncbi:MAG: NAD-dependent epimerase/dehydratase family protein [Elusimicrobia bacterium]|nr:NAD-dependent epimerase/dehydratase family protein [Elusimicrobiota bacterium]